MLQILYCFIFSSCIKENEDIINVKENEDIINIKVINKFKITKEIESLSEKENIIVRIPIEQTKILEHLKNECNIKPIKIRTYEKFELLYKYKILEKVSISKITLLNICIFNEKEIIIFVTEGNPYLLSKMEIILTIVPIAILLLTFLFHSKMKMRFILPLLAITIVPAIIFYCYIQLEIIILAICIFIMMKRNFLMNKENKMRAFCRRR